MENNVMKKTAFNYLVEDICNVPKIEIAKKLSVDKSEVTNMGTRKRGVDIAHIEKLEKIFGVPCCYWLDEKAKVSGKQIRTRYAKKLTIEVKQKIDSYLSYKKYKEGEIVEDEMGYNPYMREVFDMDTDIVLEQMKYMLYSIVYADLKKEYYYDGFIYNRALVLQDMLKSIEDIGIDNVWEYKKALKEQRYKAVGMTLEEIEEYESLFGKIEIENASE